MNTFAIRRATLLAALSCCVGACSKQQQRVAMPPPKVEIVTIKTSEVPIYREWIGTLDGSANVDVRARVQGYIQEIAFTEGRVVREGDLLLKIDPRPLEAELAQAKAELARAVATQGKADLDEKRQSQLFATKAVSQQDYDNAVQNNLAAKASVESAKARVLQAELNLGYATITSPITGIVGRTEFSIGDFLAAGATGTPVATVSTVDPIKFVFSLTERAYLEAAEKMGPAMEKPLAQREAVAELIRADGRPHTELGRFLAVDREVDAGTGTIRVSLLFPNPGNVLRPGQSARVRLKVRQIAEAVRIPQRSVLELQGRNYVWLLGSDNKVTQRPVRPGPRVGSDWVIEEGLKPGDRVVVEGIQKAREGATVDPVPFALASAAGHESSKPE